MTYVQLGNHTRKHRVKHTTTKSFGFTNHRSKSNIRAAISTHQKCLADDYKCGLILMNLQCQSTNQNALACETFVFGLDNANPLRPFQTYNRTYRLVIRVPGCQAGSWHVLVKLLANVTKYSSYLLTKYHVSVGLCIRMLSRKYLQVFIPLLPRIESDIHAKSAAFN